MAALPINEDCANLQTLSHGVSGEDCSVLHGCNCKDKVDRSSIMISLLSNTLYHCDMVIIKKHLLLHLKLSLLCLKNPGYSRLEV